MVMIASPHRCTRAVGNGASRPRRKSWPVGGPYYYQLVAPVAIGKKTKCPIFAPRRKNKRVSTGQSTRARGSSQMCGRAKSPIRTASAWRAKAPCAARDGPAWASQETARPESYNQIRYSLIFSYGAAGPPTMCSRKGPAIKPEQPKRPTAQSNDNALPRGRQWYFSLLLSDFRPLFPVPPPPSVILGQPLHPPSDQRKPAKHQ